MKLINIVYKALDRPSPFVQLRPAQPYFEGGMFWFRWNRLVGS